MEINEKRYVCLGIWYVLLLKYYNIELELLLFILLQKKIHEVKMIKKVLRWWDRVGYGKN